MRLAALVIVIAIASALLGCSSHPATPHETAAAPDLQIPAIPKTATVAAQTPTAASEPSRKRVNDLFDHPELLGTAIDVEVYEPLYDADHSSGADKGEFYVEVTDVDAYRLKITPGLSSAETAAGALAKLPTDLTPPIRIQGVLAKTPAGIRIVAYKIEPLAFPEPIRISSAKEITDHREKWAGQYVTVEDTWTLGFEMSFLGSAWLHFYPNVTLHCDPPSGGASAHGPFTQPVNQRVRVTGYVYTATGQYGHLGMADAKVVATDVVYIDPKRPECR